MINKSKTQPTAFRLTEETLEKFRDIAQDLGTNQEQALAKLIEVYEMEKGKETIPEMRDNIETFEGYVRAAANMYLQVLEANQSMRALVRTEFESQLKSKDRTIEDLQARVDNAEMIAAKASEKIIECQDAADEKVRVSQEQVAELEGNLFRLNNQIAEERTMAKERESHLEHKYVELNEGYEKLRTSEEELRKLTSSLMKETEQLKEKTEHLQKERRELDAKVFELGRENESLSSEIKREKKNAEDELARQKKEFEFIEKNIKTEQQLQLQVLENKLREQHKVELDELRKELDKYKDLYYQK